MIKKNSIGDYVATCDQCHFQDPAVFYDFRQAQSYFINQGWILQDDGSVYCPYCKQERLDSLVQ